MRFRLTYRGILKSNGDAAEKHALRKHFHQQLSWLWKQKPLVERNDLLDPTSVPGAVSILHQNGSFRFLPLVSSKLELYAAVNILFLRPEPPGALKTRGDIDNRLKTLLDALKVPEANALPKGAVPAADEDPFFCLVEDDSLLTTIAASVDTLLEPVTHSSAVQLLIQVETFAVRVNRLNMGLF